MRLQVLVNHYKEPFEIIRRLLDSIDEQTGIDGHSVEILVCTDGEEYAFTDSDFVDFKTPIRYFVMPHRGVCMTRNMLLDLSDAEYLMFCDCDDMFSKTDGLKKLIEAAEQTGANVVGSDYSIEHMIRGELVCRPCVKNITRVHGKIFRRSYLIEQDIRYPDEMTFSGDMYFLYLAYHLTDKIVWLTDNFYTWKWMPESVTRGKSHYSVRTYDKMIQCYVLAMRELIRRKRPDLYYTLIMARINGSYFDWYSKKFEDAPEEFRATARESIRQMVKEFYWYYMEIPIDERKQNYIGIQISRRTYGPPGKFVGLACWMNEIMDNII